MVVAPLVVVTVVIVVPVTLVIFPPAVIVVVVRMGPVRVRIRRAAPSSGGPHIPFPRPVPIPIIPSVARTWHRRANLVAQRRRFVTNVDTDLGEGWSGHC